MPDGQMGTGFEPDETTPAGEADTVETTTGGGTPSGADETGDFKQRMQGVAREASESGDAMVERIQLRELREWRDGEFRESMTSILEAQQEICTEEGMTDKCEEGRQMFAEMFGGQGEAEPVETPTN